MKPKAPRVTKKQRQHEAEIIYRLGSLLDDYTIGLYPVRHDQGDHYRCPACAATKATLGYAMGQEHLDQAEHDDRCDLMQLYQLYQEYVTTYAKPDQDSQNSDSVSI